MHLSGRRLRDIAGLGHSLYASLLGKPVIPFVAQGKHLDGTIIRTRVFIVCLRYSRC
jgi:hypothetical protein